MSSRAIPREIVLGVGGGIAAYKSADLLRRLQDQGFLVTVIPTANSLNFVGKTTWEALSGRPVQTDLWNNVHLVPHISVAQNAQAIVIAPATADLIARLANGRADDYLTNVVLASTSPLLLVPAMHPQMWFNEATLANVALLRSRGITVLEPDDGPLTSGDSGVGRFPKSAAIVEALRNIIDVAGDLVGKKVLITAGGTREAIDPVRYIGNNSSGKQGYAIAEAALQRGAQVTLISANVSLPAISGAEMVFVTSAAQMFDAVQERFPASDLLIMSAAVADLRPSTFSEGKIPKSELTSISLTPNPDIVASVQDMRKPSQIVVGFAAETEGNIRDRGRSKLLAKGLDLIYVNDVSGGAIFGEEESSGWIISKIGSEIKVPLSHKSAVAHMLLDHVISKLG